MKTINLTRGMFCIVDDDDFENISKFKWYAAKQPNTYYAVRDTRIDGKKKTIWMHRVINNTPDSLKTDHINGNGLDNRKENLRSVNHQDNMINSHKWRKRQEHRGISWHKGNRKWYAQITVDRKNIYIGSYHDKEEAIAAYKKAREKYRQGKIKRSE